MDCEKVSDMEIIDPGHYYKLHTLDQTPPDVSRDLLRFVKREGEGYPGNRGHHSGTTTQEVLRALIDRTLYVNYQIPHWTNTMVLDNMRQSIWLLEKRAAERHGREFPDSIYSIELSPFCKTCGHIGCTEH